jgi:2-keto-3-deoxy-L-rhamnonate aldolase RhmA
MSEFARKLRAGEVLAGTWIKTPHPTIVEVLSLTELDCLVLDGEHAPFDRGDIDMGILAARANQKPILVRPPSSDPAYILNALDCGADGVILPHICNGDQAREAVRACHYVPGGRGFAGSSRAAGYTTKGMARHRHDAKNVIIIAQIEDKEAIDNIEDIAAVEGIDALFIGRADLTVSFDAQSPDDDVVVAAVETVVRVARHHGRTSGMFLSRTADIAHWKEKGASLFILGSDHDFLLQGGRALKQAVGN